MSDLITADLVLLDENLALPQRRRHRADPGHGTPQPRRFVRR